MNLAVHIFSLFAFMACVMAISQLNAQKNLTLKLLRALIKESGSQNSQQAQQHDLVVVHPSQLMIWVFDAVGVQRSSCYESSHKLVSLCSQGMRAQIHRLMIISSEKTVICIRDLMEILGDLPIRHATIEHTIGLRSSTTHLKLHLLSGSDLISERAIQLSDLLGIKVSLVDESPLELMI